MKFKVTGLRANEKWDHGTKETVETFEVSLESKADEIPDQSIELELRDVNEFEKYRYGRLYEMELKPVD